ncbi:phosphotransferase family protein [Prescottella defluvii]|nr:phosphotransferase family protein [Prescottella defluvii]
MGVVGLNEDAVSTWITGLGVGALAPLSFERIGTGQSNLTFAVRDSGGGRWVLRRPPLGRLLASAHDVEREHRILSALQGTGVPVPKMLGLTTDPAITDAPLVLMSYVDGVIIDDIVDGEGAAGQLTPERRRAIGLSLPKALASIHRVDLESAGLLDLASTKPYAARQLKRWSAQWAQSRTHDVPAIESLAERLSRNTRSRRKPRWCTAISISATSSPRPTTAGWSRCWTGSCARSAIRSPTSAGCSRTGRSAATACPGRSWRRRFEGFPTRDELVEVYVHETKRDVSAVGFWHVLALWKLAIIVEGVVRRTIDDPRNRAEAGAPTAEFFDAVVRRAVATADEVGLR